MIFGVDTGGSDGVDTDGGAGVDAGSSDVVNEHSAGGSADVDADGGAGVSVTFNRTSADFQLVS